MRLTREKIIRLSHQITEVLVESEEVEFVDDRDTAWASPPRPTTAIAPDFFEVVISLRLSVVSEEGVSTLPEITEARWAV